MNSREKFQLISNSPFFTQAMGIYNQLKDKQPQITNSPVADEAELEENDGSQKK